MSNLLLSSLRQLDHCIPDREALSQLRAMLDKVEKCCQALDRKLNLADVLGDPKNLGSLRNVFGKSGYEAGLQMVVRLALGQYEVRSFTLRNAIEGKRKLDFLHRSVGGWKQFDAVVFLQPQAPGKDLEAYRLINPAKAAHWQTAQAIPAGTLISVYLKTLNGNRSRSQESLALERFEAVFDLVQSRADLEDSQAPAPVIPMRPQAGSKPVTRPASSAPARPTFSSFRSKASVSTDGPPAASFSVVISKMDTFVHAGNAHLITSHLGDYQGQVKFYVLRGSKQAIQLDADSIWGAEIRNGETVLYEFFGPKPADEFLKELGKRTNKYTQMDKIANE